jgi:predicted DNA-binding transcriptional regulator AlpA
MTTRHHYRRPIDTRVEIQKLRTLVTDIASEHRKIGIALDQASTALVRLEKGVLDKLEKRTLDKPRIESVSEGQLITARALSLRLALSRQTLWRMVREARLPAPIHISPMCIRWREADIAAWVAER